MEGLCDTKDATGDVLTSTRFSGGLLLVTRSRCLC